MWVYYAVYQSSVASIGLRRCREAFAQDGAYTPDAAARPRTRLRGQGGGSCGLAGRGGAGAPPHPPPAHGAPRGAWLGGAGVVGRALCVVVWVESNMGRAGPTCAFKSSS